MRGKQSQEALLRSRVTKLTNNTKRYRAEIQTLKVLLKEKDEKILDLETRLKDKEAQRKDLLAHLYKPKHCVGDKKQQGKKQGAPAYHRPTPKAEDVTETHTYTLNTCPLCNHRVGRAHDTVVKYEEDIALRPRPTVSKHIITRHWCSHCELYVKTPTIPEIHRIGVKTLGYILYAHYHLRLPFNRVKESLRDLYGFRISEGEIALKLKEAQGIFGKEHDTIIALVQIATRVYADETGWRMDGKNWCLWVFVTEKGIRYVIEDTRGKGVAERVLGDKEDRVIISDGYAGYQNLPGEKQQCWVHLIRVAKHRSLALYGDLCVLYKKLLLELEKPIGERDRGKFEGLLETLIVKHYAETEAHTVQERMRRHKPFLFTCLSYEGVLPENNTAERAIRPQVIMRKISGGSRSVKGAQARAVNMTVLETYRRRNPDTPFFDVVLPLLQKGRAEG